MTLGLFRLPTPKNKAHVTAEQIQFLNRRRGYSITAFEEPKKKYVTYTYVQGKNAEDSCT
jgi:hypothetical protein